MTDRPDKRPLGGIVHTYRGYDPVRFPPPTAPPGDSLGALGDRLLATGSRRRFTPEELAEAIRIPPEAIAGLGPSIDALLAELEARRDRILDVWNPSPTVEEAGEIVDERASTFFDDQTLPLGFRDRFAREVRERQIHGL